MKEQDQWKRPYNSRIIDSYVKLIKLRYKEVDLTELLSYSELELHQIADQACWFTQKQVDRFYEKLVQLTGNKKIAREAGQFFASFQEGNLLKKYFLSLLGPIGAFEKVESVSKNFTNYTEYRVKKLSSNSVEVSVQIKGEVEEKPYQCENRRGMIEAIPMLFGLKIPRVEHSDCLFKNGKACRYVVTWESSRTVTVKKIQSIMLTVVILTNIITGILNPGLTFATILPMTTILSLILYLIRKKFQVAELLRKVQAAQNTTDELFHQIDLNYNNTQISQKLGQAANEKITVDELLKEAMSISEGRLEFDRGLILLANNEKTALQFKSGFGYNSGYQELLNTTAFNLDNPQSKGVFVVCFKEKRPFLINDVEDIKKDLSLRSIAFTKSLGSRAFICCPIVCDNEAIGILSVDNLHSQRPLIQSDISQLMAIASVIGVGIKKVQLIRNREIQFQSIIKVLASSIDARDPLTSGHSEKVSEYSDAIAVRLGISEKERDIIRIASLLHDYGKIGVPDHILKKNGRLTVDEFSIIKTHVEKTRDILNQINFEDDYSEIPAIAGSHHERVDGMGYPSGLKGKEIPLGARIIAAADFYDAITSQRHYRNPMEFEQAIKILREEAGAHLDPRIVKILCEYLRENYSDLPMNDDTHEEEAGRIPLQIIKGV